MNKSKVNVKGFGMFLSDMVMPNIGAFMAWGLITALFIPSGWMPNEHLAKLVNPMVHYLIPLLIGYTGGSLIWDKKGGVVGAVATLGIIIGADIPMFLGAMIMGPLGGLAIKKFDNVIEGRIPKALEVLVDNLGTGIIAAILTILSFVAIGPVVILFNNIIKNSIEIIVNIGLLPLASVFIEPSKILFLNTVINHGILAPIGIQETRELGKSIFFLLESNPGPGLGILLAYWRYGKGVSKESAPGAIIIQFIGGIHEIYFPYVLMRPILILAAIAGGISGIITFQLFGAGLMAPASVGSIIMLLVMSPKGGYLGVLAGVIVSATVSFLVASMLMREPKNKH